MKTILTVLVCAALICAPQAQALGATGSEADFTYTVTDGKATITGYVGAGGEVTAPGTLGDAMVTGISYNAFANQAMITTLTLPEGIAVIPAGALYGCTAMTRILLPDSLETIGERAFSNCPGLAAIAIPAGVNEIGPLAFYTYTQTDVTVDGGNARYEVLDGVLYDKVDKVLNYYPAMKADTSYTVPKGTLGIGDSAFFTCYSLNSVILPEGLTSIGDHAFYSCDNLAGLVLPDSLTTIETGAFSYCRSMQDITIPNGVTRIGYSAFAATAMDKIVLEDGNAVYESIDGVLYDKVNKILHTYPNKKTDVQFTVPDGTASIGDNAFWQAFSLKSITLPESILSIGTYVFAYCTGIEAVTLPTSLEELGKLAFYTCSALVAIEIPDGITALRYGTFIDCTNLANVTIPDSVAEIESSVFDGCPALVIHASADSYAQQYAAENNIPFVIR